MADKSTNSLLYTVTTRPDAEQVRQVSLGWRQVASEAAYIIDLINYPVSFSVPQSTPHGPTVTLGAVALQVEFASAQDAQNLACWIAQNIAADGKLSCPPPNKIIGEAQATSPDRRTTVAFCVAASGDRVSLTWDMNTQEAYYAIVLSDIEVAPPSPLSEGEVVTRAITVRRRVPFASAAVVTDLACWVADNVIVDKPVDCVEFVSRQDNDDKSGDDDD